LDAVAREYDPSDAGRSFDHALKQLQAAAVLRHLSGDRVLELGCATGELTALLSPACARYTVVEGSAVNVETARRRVPEAVFVHSFWETFVPEEQFSDVLLVNALEHSMDPGGLLARVRPWLYPQGRVHVMVPNGLSLHRLLGVELGILHDPVALSEDDRRQGHHRNYTLESLLDIVATEVDVVHHEGIFLKLLSNAQMLGWDDDLVAALGRLGGRFEEHAAILYAVGQAR